MTRPKEGDVIRSKYRIITLIGDGGMGSVYEARHEVLGTPVALKFLHPELARRPGLVSRFIQEAKVSASIQSPHVTRVHDVDQTEDGAAFIVMELLAGEPLQSVLDREGRLPRHVAIEYSLQILAGLAAAHALGVVHRDLKPDNVFVTSTAGGTQLRLLDFGIAKLRDTSEFKRGLTRPGAIMGTPEYMAPEQAYSADQVDHRADIYSMGVMLYEMLTGERPANGDDAHVIISRVTTGSIKHISEHDASIPPPLADVVHRAMAARPEARFASALEMRAALAQELTQSLPPAATPAPPAGLAAGLIPPPTESLAPRSQVPKTLPPEDSPPQNATAPLQAVSQALTPDKGSTQSASPEAVQEQMRMTGMRPEVGMMAPAYGPPPGAPPGQAYGPVGQGPAAHGYGPPGQPPHPGALPGPGMAPGPGMMPGAFAPPGHYAGHGGKQGGFGKALVWILLTVMAGAAVTLGIIYIATREDDAPPPQPTWTDPPPATVTAESPSSPSPQPAVNPFPTATPSPSPTPGPAPRPGPAPAPKADAGAPPFVLPTELPPFPTELPPFPTEFPQIPGFPAPAPAPAPAPTP